MPNSVHIPKYHYVVFYFFLIFLKTWFFYVAQPGFKLMVILLTQPLVCRISGMNHLAWIC